MPNRFETFFYNIVLVIVAISAIYFLPLSRFVTTTLLPLAFSTDTVSASQ